MRNRVAWPPRILATACFLGALVACKQLINWEELQEGDGGVDAAAGDVLIFGDGAAATPLLDAGITFDGACGLPDATVGGGSSFCSKAPAHNACWDFDDRGDGDPPIHCCRPGCWEDLLLKNGTGTLLGPASPDPESGPNAFISNVSSDGGSAVLVQTYAPLNSARATVTFEFDANVSCSPAGDGSGLLRLAAVWLTSDSTYPFAAVQLQFHDGYWWFEACHNGSCSLFQPTLIASMGWTHIQFVVSPSGTTILVGGTPFRFYANAETLPGVQVWLGLNSTDACEAAYDNVTLDIR